MEQREIHEEDRDEIRRFAEYLARRKAERDGKNLPPLPDEMRKWLLGLS